MIVKPEHFRYLYVQRGEVSDAFKQGLGHWQSAYEQSLARIMENIAPALPEACSEILDVGGGLGGIGILLGRRYPLACYSVLDGTDDEPEVRSHSSTFNHAATGYSFHRDNDHGNVTFWPAWGTESFEGKKFDLVVSFAAWGFHICPGDYLDLVKKSLAPKATVILDVRKNRAEEWVREFLGAFGTNAKTLEQGKKHVRIAWKT